MKTQFTGALFLAGAMCVAQAQDGAAIYKSNCAGCHDSAASHAPAPRIFRQMYPESVLRSMETGSMKDLAASLTGEQRRAVAVYLAGKDFGKAPELVAKDAYCSQRTGDFSDPLRKPGWNGWSPDLANTRFQPAPGLRAEDVPKLTLRWAFGIPGATIANAQPSVVNGHLFLGTPGPAVYSLSAKTGCVEWVFEPSAAVRTGITIGKTSRLPGYAAFFGDGRANVYAIDAAKGTLIWKTNVEDFPSARITGTPKLYADRLYVPIAIIEEGLAVNPKYECCRSRPSVIALDASTGQEIWRHYTTEQDPKPTGKNAAGTQLWGPSGPSVWSAPTLDPQKKAVYVATGNNFSHPTTNTSDAILALHMDTGKLLWSRQIDAGDAYNVACVSLDRTNCPQPSGPDWDFGASPILVQLPGGKRALLAGQKSGVMTALDPDNQGEIIWQTRVGKGGLIGGIEWGPAADAENVYVALSDMAWIGDRVFDPSKGGGLFALRLGTGEKIWVAPPPDCQGRKKCSPAQSAAISACSGVVFSGSEDGHILGYSTKNVKVIWDFDTAREYDTVNHVPARGGSIDGPGPAIADGMLYVPSGYATWGGLPGNVLLAFSVEGK